MGPVLPPGNRNWQLLYLYVMLKIKFLTFKFNFESWSWTHSKHSLISCLCTLFPALYWSPVWVIRKCLNIILRVILQ